MRLNRPGVLAIMISLIMGGIVLLTGAIVYAFVPELFHWEELLIVDVWAMLVVFFLIKVAVNRFIYSKVKIIYKNIHELKIGTSKDEPELISTDLDDVSREVAKWAEQNETEIQELKEREQFRREFVGNIFHELKTPIFNIQGFLLTLLDGAAEDENIREKYLIRANKSVDRMISIIDSLETISHLETNRITLEQSHFDVIALVRECFEQLEYNAKKRSITLRLKTDYEKPLMVRADRGKVEQVFTNLIINAIKYGKEKGHVEVCFYDMDKNVLVEVADNGLGIPQGDIQRIFERFYRVDKSRSRQAGGTGLGLSIVKHILESHKQSISVRSSEDAGSTFSFTLKKAK